MFRIQVIKAQQQRLLGRVIVTQPISIYSICIIVFITFLLLLIYLTNSHYSRKETVKGYLIPKKGVVKVFSNRTGVVENIYVNEGDRVKKGSDIVKIKNSQSLSTGIELSVALSKELSIQINNLKNEYDAVLRIYDKDLTRIDRQLIQLNKSLTMIQNAKDTNLQKTTLKKKRLDKNRRLFTNGFLSSNQLDTVHGEYLDSLESHDYLDRELSTIQVEISTLESERFILPEQLILKKTAIKLRISELTAQLTELNNQYEFIKKAPEAGIVTAIQPTIGTQIDANTPLLSIIPVDSPMEIELLLPTRSAGFVQLGDTVNIRFDAFPYQKFGAVIGQVSNIDKALILPSDKILPIKIDEAMYRVRARLTQQSIHAYGKTFPLKVGMIADADIILEKRSLLEWLLDPIYAVKGKLG